MHWMHLVCHYHIQHHIANLTVCREWRGCENYLSPSHGADIAIYGTMSERKGALCCCHCDCVLQYC